jgi:hypothetical protein
MSFVVLSSRDCKARTLQKSKKKKAELLGITVYASGTPAFLSVSASLRIHPSVEESQIELNTVYRRHPLDRVKYWLPVTEYAHILREEKKVDLQKLCGYLGAKSIKLEEDYAIAEASKQGIGLEGGAFGGQTDLGATKTLGETHVENATYDVELAQPSMDTLQLLDNGTIDIQRKLRKIQWLDKQADWKTMIDQRTQSWCTSYSCAIEEKDERKLNKAIRLSADFAGYSGGAKGDFLQSSHKSHHLRYKIVFHPRDQYKIEEPARGKRRAVRHIEVQPAVAGTTETYRRDGLQKVINTALDFTDSQTTQQSSADGFASDITRVPANNVRHNADYREHERMEHARKLELSGNAERAAKRERDQRAGEIEQMVQAQRLESQFNAEKAARKEQERNFVTKIEKIEQARKLHQENTARQIDRIRLEAGANRRIDAERSHKALAQDNRGHSLRSDSANSLNASTNPNPSARSSGRVSLAHLESSAMLNNDILDTGPWKARRHRMNEFSEDRIRCSVEFANEQAKFVARNAADAAGAIVALLQTATKLRTINLCNDPAPASRLAAGVAVTAAYEVGAYLTKTERLIKKACAAIAAFRASIIAIESAGNTNQLAVVAQVAVHNAAMKNVRLAMWKAKQDLQVVLRTPAEVDQILRTYKHRAAKNAKMAARIAFDAALQIGCYVGAAFARTTARVAASVAGTAALNAVQFAEAAAHANEYCRTTFGAAYVAKKASQQVAKIVTMMCKFVAEQAALRASTSAAEDANSLARNVLTIALVLAKTAEAKERLLKATQDLIKVEKEKQRYYIYRHHGTELRFGASLY